ncbi:hypothetical protein ABZ863_06275 [Saccharomonospora sp. NPDC046836]|uniref:hypothetical protein n=1 Tax=Saccharomonospora sp. NPDC046836 TaxID=3156921 RepID=UPI0033CE7C16
MRLTLKSGLLTAVGALVLSGAGIAAASPTALTNATGSTSPTTTTTSVTSTETPKADRHRTAKEHRHSEDSTTKKHRPAKTPPTSAAAEASAGNEASGEASASTPTPSGTPTSSGTQASDGTQASGEITFYAAADNDPPGSRAIAYPKSSGAATLHDEAGGTGTYEDPLTFAAAEGQFAPGTRIYVPLVQRYFIMEDSCASCGDGHIDLWAGSATDQGVIACEEKLTPSGNQPYEINPPPGRQVVAGDLYQNGSCGLSVLNGR